MNSQQSPSPYSRQFLALWLTATALGGVLGAVINLLLTRQFLAGLALGIVSGNTIVVGVYVWRNRTVATPPLPDLNIRLLHWVLGMTALGVVGYLIAGWWGVPFNRLFPWDGLGLLALCGLAEIFLRRGQSFWAASCLTGGFFLPIAFNAQFYGMSSPVNALYLLGILVSGLVLGSNGFFGALAAICVLTGLFAIGERQGQWETIYPVGTPAQSVGWVLFWWAVYSVSAWLSWLFARSLERALQVSRGQTLTLARTLNAIAPDSSLETSLKQALAAIAEQLGATYALLWLHHPPDDTIGLHLAHVAGKVVIADEVTDSALLPTPARELPVWEELRRTRRPFVIDDVANDMRLRNRALILAQNIQTILYVPLLMGDEVLGFFSINSVERRRWSNAEDLELAQALVQQATLAMQLTRLAEQDRLAAVLAERNRMAREIHDTLAQGLTGIVVQLEAAEDVLGDSNGDANKHLSRARALARESLAEARRSVYALRPQSLEHRPLPLALRESITALTANTRLLVEWQISNGWPDQSPDLEADLLRVGQEAVTNVLRHANAQRLRVSLRAMPDAVELEVSDDGCGFDLQAVRPRPEGGFGLLGMGERVAQHGGQLLVTSGEGEGTTVKCVIPARNVQTARAAPHA